MNVFRRNGYWLLGILLVALASLSVMFGPQAAAAGDGPDSRDGSTLILHSWPLSAGDRQIFNEDLVVEAGQVIDENVAVFNGDAEVKAGGAIQGNLSVFRGDVKIAGRIEGNLAVMGGDVELKSSAHISGDVSILGGEVKREPGAYVGGNFLGGGQNLPFVGPPDDGPGRIVPNIGIRPNVPLFTVSGLGQWLLRFFWRLVQAFFWTVLLSGLVVLVMLLAPSAVESATQVAISDPALSFVVGLFSLLAVLFLAFLLSVTICLAPVSALLMVLVAVVGLVGWTISSYLLGQRVTELLETRLQPLAMSALGAVLLTGVTSFFWAIVPCLGWIVALLLGSTGVGALIVRQSRASGSFGLTPAGGPAGGDDEGAAQPDVEAPAAESEAEEAEETSAATAGPPVERATAEKLGLPVQAVEQAQALTEADFTQLKGIGPAFNRRLKAANVRTFADLAAMTPEQVADILGRPAERVVRDRIVEQARELAG